MSAWLPAVKIILPYLTQIVTAVIPAFTKKVEKGKAEDAIPGQISELQDAATHNAESIKILAMQLQQAISSIDAGAIRIEKEIRLVKRLSILAIAAALVAIALVLASRMH